MVAVVARAGEQVREPDEVSEEFMAEEAGEDDADSRS